MEKIKIKMPDGREGSSLEKIPHFILTALVFILPIFFIPWTLLPFAYSKIIILSLAVLLSLFVWVVLSFKTGKLIMPWGWFSLAIVGVPLISLLASLFSGNR